MGFKSLQREAKQLSCGIDSLKEDAKELGRAARHPGSMARCGRAMTDPAAHSRGETARSRSPMCSPTSGAPWA